MRVVVVFFWLFCCCCWWTIASAAYLYSSSSSGSSSKSSVSLPAATTSRRLHYYSRRQRQYRRLHRRDISSRRDSCAPSRLRDEERRPPGEVENDDDDLTSEELDLRFRDVLAHFLLMSATTSSSNTTTITTTTTVGATTGCASSEEEVKEAVRARLLRVRHAKLRLRRCTVAPSTIPGAGQGVFATRAIVAGDLLTLYPGDALIVWDNHTHVEDRGSIRVLLGSSNSTACSSTTPSFADSFGTMQSADVARQYEVRVSGVHSVIGDPRRCHDAAYLGHMLNDCACLVAAATAAVPPPRGLGTATTTAAAPPPAHEQGRLGGAAYAVQSRQGANAKIKVGADGCHVEIVATRSIAAGDECFLSYGEDYWRSRLSVDSTTKATPPPTTPRLLLQEPLPQPNAAKTLTSPPPPLAKAFGGVRPTVGSHGQRKKKQRK